MTGDQKKRGVFLALLVAISIGNIFVLYKGHLFFNLPAKKSTDFDDFGLTASRLPNGELHLTMTRKPENLVLLDSQPEEIEPELKTGRWLILEYAVINVQDASMLQLTGTISQRFSGLCRVAIRPTKNFDDIPKWLPHSELEYEGYHPVWFAMENGKVLAVTGYSKSEREIRQFVEKAFGSMEDTKD